MEKLLVSHSVFKRIVLQTRKNQGLFGKESKQKCIVTCTVNVSLLYQSTKYKFNANKIEENVDKTVSEKNGENDGNLLFLLFPQFSKAYSH